MNLNRKTVCLLLAVLLLPTVALAGGEKNRIAVMKFTCTAGSGTHWWHDASWDIGWGMAEMLTTALVSTNAFRVVERQELEGVLGEQDFGASGRVDSGTEAKIGKVLGANLLAYGTVNEFEYSEKGTGGGLRIKGIGVGGGVAKAHIGMDVRVVDATTSEILFSQRFTQDASRKNVNLSVTTNGVGGDIGTFKNTPLGEATRAAIDQSALAIAEKLAGAAVSQAPAWTGTLLVADDGSLVLKAGKGEGLKDGDLLDVFKPKTVTVGGETMNVGEEKVGRIKLVTVGDKASVATSVEGSGFKTGYAVKVVRE